MAVYLGNFSWETLDKNFYRPVNNKYPRNNKETRCLVLYIDPFLVTIV